MRARYKRVDEKSAEDGQFKNSNHYQERSKLVMLSSFNLPRELVELVVVYVLLSRHRRITYVLTEEQQQQQHVTLAQGLLKEHLR
jgi:hypothetical protein